MDSGKLTLTEKFNLLIHKGTFLKSVTLEYRKVNIYVMDGKYYGVRFDPAGDLVDKIEEIEDSVVFSVPSQLSSIVPSARHKNGGETSSR